MAGYAVSHFEGCGGVGGAVHVNLVQGFAQHVTLSGRLLMVHFSMRLLAALSTQ